MNEEQGTACPCEPCQQGWDWIWGFAKEAIRRNDLAKRENDELKAENATLRGKLDAAQKACRAIDDFCTEIFCGRPLSIDGREIDHTRLNDAWHAAQRVLRR